MSEYPVTAYLDGREPLEGTFRIEREPDDLDFFGDKVTPGRKEAILTVPVRIGDGLNRYPGDRITYRIVGADGSEHTGWGHPVHISREAREPRDDKVRYENCTEIRGGLDS
jgi:hypothetical protein